MLERRVRWFVGLTLGLVSACSDDPAGDSGTAGASESTGTSSSSTTDAPETASTRGENPGPGGTTGSDATSESESEDSTASTTSSSSACEGLTFFATSEGSGDAGGDLGGLAGADATCQRLAEAVGQGGCTWRAYLSTSEEHARDRIGTGPWFNAAGERIAADVDALHTGGLSNGAPQHVLDENGEPVPGNEHDILTGSQADGTLLEGSTCADWTSSSDGVARVGHSDIPSNPMFSPSWNSAHDTPGCAPQQLQQVGGAGRLYCFAID